MEMNDDFIPPSLSTAAFAARAKTMPARIARRISIRSEYRSRPRRSLRARDRPGYRERANESSGKSVTSQTHSESLTRSRACFLALSSMEFAFRARLCVRSAPAESEEEADRENCSSRRNRRSRFCGRLSLFEHISRRHTRVPLRKENKRNCIILFRAKEGPARVHARARASG